MSDRFGPSEDCPVCGVTCSFGHFVHCEECGKDMCFVCFRKHEWCKDNHTCRENDNE